MNHGENKISVRRNLNLELHKTSIMKYLTKINDIQTAPQPFWGTVENSLIPNHPWGGKNSFLVFKQNKYITVPTEKIAFFYIKYDAPVIVCFDKQEYAVNYSLEQIQKLVSGLLFYRLNRQYLISFYAIKEVEHYFARKLLVNLVVPVTEK